VQKVTALPTSAPGNRALSDRFRSLIQIRYVAALTVLAVYGLMVLGGAVRATDSGTACPDWPLCHGHVIPPADTKVWIEWSHRLVASAVGFLIFGLVLRIWFAHRGSKLLVRAGIVAAALLALQVIVGGITVGTETNATVVAIHLTIALSLISTLIVIAVAAFREAEEGAPVDLSEPRQTPWHAILTLVSVYALIVVGAYVSQMHAGLAYPDWPLFDGGIVSTGGKLANVHYAHRLLAGFVGLMMAGLLVRTLRREDDPMVVSAMGAAFFLYVVQVFVGASNIWFDLATSVRILHLALASAMWAVLLFAVAWSYLSAPKPREAAA
jgi:heme A synthase